MQGTGKITKWKTEYEIHTDTGKKVVFSIDPEIKIASGYFPKEGDIVKFVYNAGTMALTEIELIGKERDYTVGWITEWKDNSVTIRLTTGEDLKLTVDPQKIDVLVGYEPKLKDFIYLKYDEEKKALTYVRFLSRPENLDTNTLFKSVKKK